MPQGFDDLEEAELDRAPRLIDAKIGKRLRDWWLAIDSPKSKTPNFDIASTCTIENKPGLLLIEAKAHDAELLSEAAGKRLNPDASRGSKVNHERIAAAIQSASVGLQEATSLGWQLSRDSH